MTQQEKENRMIRELRQEIIASVMLIGDYDELMQIYANVLDRLYAAQ